MMNSAKSTDEKNRLVKYAEVSGCNNRAWLCLCPVLCVDGTRYAISCTWMRGKKEFSR